MNERYLGGMMWPSEDTLIPQHKELTDLIHKKNCPVIAQLALGAYYRRVGNGNDRQVEPDEMTLEEIGVVREKKTAQESRFLPSCI